MVSRSLAQQASPTLALCVLLLWLMVLVHTTSLYRVGAVGTFWRPRGVFTGRPGECCNPSIMIFRAQIHFLYCCWLSYTISGTSNGSKLVLRFFFLLLLRKLMETCSPKTTSSTTLDAGRSKTLKQRKTLLGGATNTSQFCLPTHSHSHSCTHKHCRVVKFFLFDVAGFSFLLLSLDASELARREICFCGKFFGVSSDWIFAAAGVDD